MFDPRKYTELQLLEIEHEINCWRFPDLLKKKMPLAAFIYGKNDNPLPYVGIKRAIFEKYLAPIKYKCVSFLGRKVILRHHNVVRRKAMSEKEFEEWFYKTQT